MINYETYGDFQENFPDSEQFLVISFSPSSIPLKQRWRNNGLSADFMADYLTTFFLADESDPKTVKRQKELKAAVSYIANELLENAMKFHDERTDDAIKFGIHLLKETVILFSSNCVSLNSWLKFYPIVNDLISCDLGELYVAQLEQLAEDENSKASGLGLITIMSDYGATLGWKIDKSRYNEDLVTIHTMAQIQI